MDAVAERVHGTCVAIDGRGVLVRGASGAGKSDLALRLIVEPSAIGSPAILVADDQVLLSREGSRLIARAPAAIAGRIEARGIGIIEVASAVQAELALVVDLVALDSIERLPDDSRMTLLGVEVPLVQIAPFEASAPTKVRLALARKVSSG